MAELPNVDAQGDTLAATLENLKQSIVTFLPTNRDRSFLDLADNAVTEIVLLEAATSFVKSFDASVIVRVTFDTQ